ncbi:MAG TPA: hypothetical protein VNZ58_10335 [Thermomicrobiales bacterium]|nr:hypothetical protein [Thermomicrobiales bacterium]
MIMTQIAMMDPGPGGDSIVSRCCRGIAHFFGFGEVREGPTPPGLDRAQPDVDPGNHIPTLHLVSSQEPEPAALQEMKWRRHAQLREQPANSLDTIERQARQQAVRGLYAAHAGDLDIATRHFTRAASHEKIDLSELPGFWTLSRRAMMAAVQGYEAAGRLRDASALNARIRMQFRPRAVPAVPGNVTELRPRRVSLTGNS